MFRIGYYSTVGNELKLLSDAYSKLYNDYKDLELMSFCGKDMNKEGEKERFFSYLEDLDLLIVSLHGGIEKSPGFFEMMERLNKNSKICLLPSSTGADLEDCLEYSNIDRHKWSSLVEYYNNSGERNFINMLRFLVNSYHDKDLSFEAPRKLPFEGIYYRGEESIDSVDDYIEKYYLEDRITIGVVFHRSQWINNNVEFIDDLIDIAEDRDLNIIPLFTNTIRVEELGNLGAKKSMEKYFYREGQLLVDAVINLTMFSMTLSDELNEDIFHDLNVPVIKGILSFNEKEKWEETYQALSPIDVSISIAMPEFDGNIITLPIAFSDRNHIDPVTKARVSKYISNRERADRILELAENWASLRYIKNEDKRLAIIFHNYPAKNHSIATAFGLDSLESVINILKEMEKRGYRTGDIPEDGQELIAILLSKATNDLRFISEKDLMERSCGSIDLDLYKEWFNKLSDKVKKEMIDKYGQIPGKILNYKNSLIVPGYISENVFIGIQPSRGNLEDLDKVHDQDLPMPHHYYAYYEWIKNVFEADCIMHIGMHGSLEWLPGKSVGLSKDCYPDIAISSLPNIYPYIINNPGEGTQAKRRSYCTIIDHLIPIMHSADSYDETAEIENLLLDYYDAELSNRAKLGQIRNLIIDKVFEANLNVDLRIDKKEDIGDFSKFIEELHGYLNELKDTQIRNGLHTLGQGPEGDSLVEFLVALTRLENGDVPSLRKTIACHLDYDLEDLLSNRGKRNSKGEINAYVIDRINDYSLEIMSRFYEKDFDLAYADEIVEEVLGGGNPDIVSILEYISKSLVLNLRRTEDEIKNCVDAAEGKFIPAGPSGSPTRGMAHILPTGRNFYSVNPKAIPSQASWELGKKLADNLLERYLEEEGVYPENIGITIAGSPTMRTKGDDVAEILYLLGVRPKWEKLTGYVADLEVIPLEELGRPRIDVTVRITGFFRDAFPNLVNLLDKAVNMVGFLDESEDDNFIVKNIKKDMEELIEDGRDLDLAREEASQRIYGCKPGGYGAGVANLINSQEWESLEDLANIYLDWSSYTYSNKSYGEKNVKSLKRSLSRMDLAVTNIDHRERGLLDSDDFYSYHGGMIAAVRTFNKKEAKSFIGDSSEVERVTTRTVDEELRKEFRARVFNPKWINSMKDHGYKGAGDIANTINHAFGWDATADAVDDFIYEDIASKFVLDEENQKWFKEVNPWALREISERLLEAIKRDMWDANEDIKKELARVYLSTEGELEGYNE